MKIRQKRQLLFSIFIDFLFLSLFFFIVCGSVLLLKFILYPEEESGGALEVRSEVMAKDFSGALSVGDTVFDTLTKRRVGEITSVSESEAEGGIYFKIKIDAAFTPRSKALRTENLWFYFARVDA